MPNYKFTGGYGRYYPDSGVFSNPGEVHALDKAPDADWVEVAEAVEPAVAPAVAAVAKDAPAIAEDALHAAEALLEANPALAQRLVDEAAKNA